MPQKVNYYAVLSRAVAGLDRDAYGARGAVYDREHRGLLRRLALADPPCSEDEIAQEEEAFRDAIRRIEFPSMRGAPVGRPEPGEARREPIETRREPIETRREPVETRREPLETRREPLETRREPIESRRAPIETRREAFETRREPMEESRREPPQSRREPMWDGPRERPSSRRELEPASYPEPSSPGEARWDRDTADDETSPEPPVPRAEPPRVEPLRAEPPRVEPLRAEPVRAEPVRAEPPRAEPVRAESPRRASPLVEPEPSGEQPRSRSIFRRIAFYARIAVLVLAAGLLAYAYATSGFDLTRLASDIDLSWLTASPNAASPQRAVLYDVRPGDRKAAPLVGKATWRTRTQASDGSGNPDTVLALDAEIPERQLAMTMTIARETETGGGMSHTFEIGFARPDQVPFGGISGVSKIVMKGAETELGDDLIGTSITVGPGNYLFGLLDTPDALRRNVELLRTRPWLGVLIVFGDGQAQMLNVEKGASGQRAIDDALAKWGQ